jgi:hypothetical protein
LTDKIIQNEKDILAFVIISVLPGSPAKNRRRNKKHHRHHFRRAQVAGNI